MALKGTEIVEKSNSLNEIRMNGMTLQELRFFSIYLAKINARDPGTRKVTFPINDFRKIMELGRMNIQHFQSVTNGLLCKVYNQPNEDGGYTGFTIFKKCRVYKNDMEEWFIEIEASDDALPMMFNLQKNYFKYELWNALRLKSANQLALYELLKQYEYLGKLEITIPRLRERLDLMNSYSRWDRFKDRVLDSCQQAMEDYTDIKFTYKRGKSGASGKWLTIIFDIMKNDKYTDQLSLNKFIEKQPEIIKEEKNEFKSEHLEFLADACDNEFDETEIAVLNDFIIKIYPSRKDDIEKYNFLHRKYHELNVRTSRSDLKPVKSRFAWLRDSLQREVDKFNAQNH